jgi:hypothetical protein
MYRDLNGQTYWTKIYLTIADVTQNLGRFGIKSGNPQIRLQEAATFASAESGFGTFKRLKKSQPKNDGRRQYDRVASFAGRSTPATLRVDISKRPLGWFQNECALLSATNL